MTPHDFRREPTKTQDSPTTTVPLGAAVTPGFERVRDAWFGLRVGHYRLLGRVGRGGMGTVYKAVRGDDQFNKTVAIKMLRLDSRDPAASSGSVANVRSSRR